MSSHCPGKRERRRNREEQARLTGRKCRPSHPATEGRELDRRPSLPALWSSVSPCPLKEPLQIPGDGSQRPIAELGAESVVPKINDKYSTYCLAAFQPAKNDGLSGARGRWAAQQAQ